MRRPRGTAKRPLRRLVAFVAAVISASTCLYYLVLSSEESAERPREVSGETRLDDLTRLNHQDHRPTNRDDLLVAVPTDEAHLPLVRAARRWRKGIRTVVAVNDEDLARAFANEGRSFNERWVAYPDDKPLRGNYPGDTRAAVVPFLAFKLIGPTFRWLLYGDDDTQWFVEGILRLVEKLDYNMPYFVTDNMWWSSVNGTIGSQPNLEAPRCLPCNYSSYGQRPFGEMRFDAPEGCPCTPRMLCAAAPRGAFDADCTIPLHLVPAFSTRTYSMHGGAGGLISVGLLQAASLEQIEDCIRRQGNSTGGDAFITICLWKLGYAHTDPGPWFNDPSMRLFDAAASLNSAELGLKLDAASKGNCSDATCRRSETYRMCMSRERIRIASLLESQLIAWTDYVLFDNMVSSHLHSRKVGGVQSAADMVALLSQAYSAYIQSRTGLAGQVNQP